jgi:hypothetical protein
MSGLFDQQRTKPIMGRFRGNTNLRGLVDWARSNG